MGFTKLSRSPGKLVSSYLAFSPLPPGLRPEVSGSSLRVKNSRTVNRQLLHPAGGGIFSVALSLGSPPVAVSDHPALWSSDFPPARRSGPAITRSALIHFYNNHSGRRGQSEGIRHRIPRASRGKPEYFYNGSFRSIGFLRRAPAEKRSPRFIRSADGLPSREFCCHAGRV